MPGVPLVRLTVNGGQPAMVFEFIVATVDWNLKSILKTPSSNSLGVAILQPLISSKKTLALSATPKRSDKLEKVLFWYFGPIIYKNDLSFKEKSELIYL